MTGSKITKKHSIGTRATNDTGKLKFRVFSHSRFREKKEQTFRWAQGIKNNLILIKSQFYFVKYVEETFESFGIDYLNNVQELPELTSVQSASTPAY